MALKYEPYMYFRNNLRKSSFLVLHMVELFKWIWPSYWIYLDMNIVKVVIFVLFSLCCLRRQYFIMKKCTSEMLNFYLALLHDMKYILYSFFKIYENIHSCKHVKNDSAKIGI